MLSNLAWVVGCLVSMLVFVPIATMWLHRKLSVIELVMLTIFAIVWPVTLPMLVLYGIGCVINFFMNRGAPDKKDLS